MEWWDKMMDPVRRVWNSVALRLGIRQRGIMKLRRDVRACEYEDVRVMWEMLKRNETENARLEKSRKRKRKRKYHHQHPPIWNCVGWARCTPY